MKNLTAKLTAIFVLTAATYAAAAAFNLDQVSEIQKGIYGAMKVGFYLGRIGGTEKDLQHIFTEMNKGNPDAMQNWINERMKGVKP